MKFKHTIVAASLVSALALSQSVASAQLLRYTFNEASGNALDTGSAPNVDGTFEGGATRSTDTPSGTGSSLDLRTEAPYAHLVGGDPADIEGLTQLTLTTWLKVETYPDAGSGNKRLVSSQGADPSFGGFSFNMNNSTVLGGLGTGTPDAFRVGFFAGSPSTLNFVNTISDADVVGASDWTFLAVSYDSVLGDMKFYTGDVDSPVTQLGTTFNTGIPDAGPVQGAEGFASRFAVGLTDAAPAADTSVTGLQDDVRVYGSLLDLAALEAVRMANIGSGPVLAADFNSDTKVDALDFNAWKTGFGLDAGATKPQGDANADMDVDGGDFLVWQNEHGSGVTGAAPIPEPTSLLLVLPAVACVGRRRARLRKQASSERI